MDPERKKLYNIWREQFKDDPAKAVGWRNQEALDKRFECTLSHIHQPIREDTLLLDYGCGTSLNLLRYLTIPHRYVGVDCNEGSIDKASQDWGIEITPFYDPEVDRQLICSETLDEVKYAKFNIILVQGVYQEFNSISDIRSHVLELSKMLAPEGELLIMTPSNRRLDAKGKSVLKISAYDAVSILEGTGLPYEIFLGELGEHIIMKAYRS